MATFFVYILYSRAIDKFYIGYTSDLDKRLDQHNHHVFKDSFTKRAKDWEIYFSICCTSEQQAKKIERHLKKNKSRKYLENLRQYPSISGKLKIKYC
ncbi:hypothetical protein GCM10028791_30050 [Echinicola sediminis]